MASSLNVIKRFFHKKGIKGLCRECKKYDGRPGYDMLWYVAITGHNECLQAVIKSGADVNKTGTHEAPLKGGGPRGLRGIKSRGCLIPFHRTALMFASSEGKSEHIDRSRS